jgi:hypothetical protein
MDKRDTTPQTLRSALAQSSGLETFGLPEPMGAEALAQRLTICARILDAWPNSRPTNRDRTLLEYVNATRGVPLDRLPKCIQLAIDAGGEWMPAAGEVLRRSAVQALGGAPVGKDPDTRYWHELKVSKTVRGYAEAAELVGFVSPEDPMLDGHEQPKLLGP